MRKIILASHNRGKIAEISQILKPFGFEVLSAADMELPEVEETGATFAENALLKASAVAARLQIPCLADDSGLCVKALGGRPGVLSARYAPDRDFNKGMEKLLAEIAASGSSDRSAYFACVLVLAFPDGRYHSFEGRVNGQIATAPSGSKGFGYDPVFIPEGFDRTFGELNAEIKNSVSHRARALQKFTEYLKRPGQEDNDWPGI